MTVVDTTVWVDYVNDQITPQTEWLHQAFGREEVGLTDLICCEVLQGFRNDVLHAKMRTQFLSLPMVDSGGLATALAASKNDRFLRSRGITVRKTIDCLIATVCIRGGHKLLHNDRDFAPFQKYLGLKTVRL